MKGKHKSYGSIRLNHLWNNIDMKIKYFIWFWFLVLSVFILFYMGSIQLEVYNRQDNAIQLYHKDNTMDSQVLYHRTASRQVLLFNLGNEQIEGRSNADKFVWFALLFMIMTPVRLYYGNYKIQWLRTTFFVGYLQKLICYLYQSDGKKRGRLLLRRE